MSLYCYDEGESFTETLPPDSMRVVQVVWICVDVELMSRRGDERIVFLPFQGLVYLVIGE